MPNGNPYRRANSGDPAQPHLTAAWFNRTLDVIGRDSSGDLDQLTENADNFKAGDVILIRNESGEDRIAGEVLGIDAPLIDRDDNLPEFKFPAYAGVTPLLPKHQGRWAVLLEDLTECAIGYAKVSGEAAAKVNIHTPGHTFADVVDGDATQLHSMPAGAAFIIEKPAGTGQHWCKVRIANGPAQGDAACISACDNCPEAMAQEWSVTLGGFTGQCSPLNDNYILGWYTGCYFTAVNPGGKRLELYHDGSTWKLEAYLNGELTAIWQILDNSTTTTTGTTTTRPPCVSSRIGTTTTPTSTSTTTAGPTTTTTGTSTTFPCGGCTYTCDGTKWVKTNEACSGFCECPAIEIGGCFDETVGQTIIFRCIDPNETTTTPTSTTTSSSTSTTSTTTPTTTATTTPTTTPTSTTPTTSATTTTTTTGTSTSCTPFTTITTTTGTTTTAPPKRWTCCDSNELTLIFSKCPEAPQTVTVSPGAQCCPRTTTGTTTTVNSAGCRGECFWQWNAAGSDWIPLCSTCDPACRCDKPDYCGSVNGQITRTNCTAGKPFNGYCCSTTSTTSHTTTSGTSTTPGEGTNCCGGALCQTVYIVVGNEVRVISRTECPEGCGCSQSACIDFETGEAVISCQTFSDPAGICFTSICPCITKCDCCGGSSCVGSCDFVSVDGEWVEARNQCAFSGFGGCDTDLPTCVCGKPSMTPPTDACVILTGVPCQGGSGDCITTTTPGPGQCKGPCFYQWDGSHWQFLSTLCTAPCVCQPPWWTGVIGETAKTNCLSGDHTTTTVTTSGTSTTAGPCGNCLWECFYDGSSWFWHLLVPNCNSSCTCIPPQKPCASTNQGEHWGTNCFAATTTATTGTTTSLCCDSDLCYWICSPDGSGIAKWTPLRPYVCNYADCGQGFTSCSGGSCVCYPPGGTCFCPGQWGQIIPTTCFGAVTTAPPTTTSTTTGTTTTGCGTCLWTCNGISWVITTNSCTGGCSCGSVAGICNLMNNGATQTTNCVP